MKVLGLVGARLGELRARRQKGGINVASVIFMAVLLALAMAVLSGAMYEMGHALHPDYAGEQAQVVADNVSEEIQAAVSRDPSMQAKLDAVGTKTWTQSVKVDNQTTTASIRVTASGAVASIDVTVNGVSKRAYAPLTAHSVAPGSVVGG